MKGLVLAVALVLALPVCASAQVPTPQERAACTPDVKKFCSAFLGPLADTWAGHVAIGFCLIGNKTNISGACRKVLADHGL